MLNLSFSGCGFLGIYHIGVVSAFREHAPEIIQNNKIAGCSAGSLVAACALCDCCLGQMVSDVLEIALKARSYSLGPLHPSFSIVEILRNGLRRILPVDAHKICSGRLNVSLTKWKDGKNWLVNTFDTREELIQALICSSFVPLYSGIIPPKFKGVYCWDGGLSNNNPILDQNTIIISPFGGDSDICPREESASYYCFDLQGTNIQWSKENFYRLSKALFPPSPQVLKAICFRGYKDAINFLKSRNLLHCSCERVIREKSTIQSLMGDDFELYNTDNEDYDSMIDSDEDQIEQYAQTAEPLKYQEMPTPVCDILDAACADHKESLINYVYNSQISRAISILFLPWTLPVEMTLLFTKKLVECLPKINVPNDSKNLVDTVLIYLNFLIQKFTYDKYQYHARVTCKLCVLKAHQIDSKVGGLKFSLCYHSGNNQQTFSNDVNIAGSTHGLKIHEIDNHNYLSDCYSTINPEQTLISLKPPVLTAHQQHTSHNHHEHHHRHHYSKPLKICARHRLPSITGLTSSENTNSIITSTTANASNNNNKLLEKQQRRRKYVSINNLQNTNSVKKQVSSLTSSYSATIHDMQSSSLSTSFKISKYFDRERTEKKLRRYKLRSITNTNNSNNNNSKSCNDLNKQSNNTTTLTEPICIPKLNLKFQPSSFDDTESVVTLKESNSENDDDEDDDENLNLSINDDENDDVYDNKGFNLNKNYKLLKKKLRKLNNNNKNNDDDVDVSSYEIVQSDELIKNVKSSITTINEINELNLDFSFNVDENKDQLQNDVNKKESEIVVDDDNDSKNSQLDFDTYLDKLELNVFGNINN